MSTLLEDARAGLTAHPKRMPPVWFYDERGSELFEAITRQPEYYPTETERGILRESADAIVAAVGGDVCLVELGAGSASKSRLLVESVLKRQRHAHFVAIDVSAEAIRLAEESITGAFPEVAFIGIEGRNRVGIRKVDWTSPEHHLVLFLGSSLGNLEPDEAARWLAEVTAPMRPGDRFLLGLDRVKDPNVLHAAYNDAAGVTAAFNKNLLTRMNRELGADFDLDAFTHYAFYNPREQRIEMHLQSDRSQVVRVPGVGEVHFAEGESIHTENSYKFTQDRIGQLLEVAGLDEVERFEDARGRFSLLLLRRTRA